MTDSAHTVQIWQRGADGEGPFAARDGRPGLLADARRAIAGLAAALALVAGCATGIVRRPSPPSPAFASARTFDYLPGVAINYEVEGTGERSAVFLHGFASSIRNWDSVRRLLEIEDLRMYFLDLKGFGFSSHERDGDYSLPVQAEIVTAFIERLGLDRTSLVGHSYGGSVAMLAALTLIDRGSGRRLDRLVLIDSAAYGDNLPLFVDFLRCPLVARGIWLIPRRLQLRVMMKRTFVDATAVTPEILGRYVFFYRQPGGRYTLRKVAQQIRPPNYRQLQERFPDLGLPAFLIWGRKDRVIPVSVGRRLARDLGAERLAILEECGHIPQEEAPEATAALLSEFLADPSGAADDVVDPFGIERPLEEE